MSSVRLAVVFYSTYGTNHQMAQVAADAARSSGAIVRLRRVAETAPPEVVEAQEKWKEQAKSMADIEVVSADDMEWANAYLFSAPTRYGVSASQLRSFIDSLGPLWQAGKLSDKAVTAMTSASNQHGGQESTLLGFYTTMMHWGAIIVPPGYTDDAVFAAGGNPYGTSITAGDELSEGSKSAIRWQTKRLVKIAEKLAASPAKRDSADRPSRTIEQNA